MQHASQTETILAQINTETKLGDLRKIAAQIKKNHELALELWSTGQFLPRQLAILIMDKKQLSQELIDKLDNDIAQHVEDERLQLADWLMANQLSKDKHTIALMETWENRQSPLQRRIYWYYQARLRWVGQKPSNSEELLAKIESRIEGEVQEVQ
ncbi:MAG TPA: DNA alkylation repair protein [Sphingobacterium sp.]|jgi:3-methyladenine DNA glycosylase AlkD|nr:DNA alkylation repair protein [Sphingobacterium sp.]